MAKLVPITLLDDLEDFENIENPNQEQDTDDSDFEQVDIPPASPVAEMKEVDDFQVINPTANEKETNQIVKPAARVQQEKTQEKREISTHPQSHARFNQERIEQEKNEKKQNQIVKPAARAEQERTQEEPEIITNANIRIAQGRINSERSALERALFGNSPAPTSFPKLKRGFLQATFQNNHTHHSQQNAVVQQPKKIKNK